MKLSGTEVFFWYFTEFRKKWIKALTNIEFYESNFYLKKQLIKFSFITAGYWTDLVTMKKIKNLSEIRDYHDFELHVNEVRKRKTKYKYAQTRLIYQILMNFPWEILYLKFFKKYNDLEDLVFRKNITYSEIEIFSIQNTVVLTYNYLRQLKVVLEQWISKKFLPSSVTITTDDNKSRKTLKIEPNSAVLNFSKERLSIEIVPGFKKLVCKPGKQINYWKTNNFFGKRLISFKIWLHKC